MSLPQQVSDMLRLSTKITLSLLIVCSWLIPTNVYADSALGPHTVFLPLISKFEVASAGEPTCQLNEQEQRIATLMISHPNQQHPTLNCNPILATVARRAPKIWGDAPTSPMSIQMGKGPTIWRARLVIHCRLRITKRSMATILNQSVPVPTMPTGCGMRGWLLRNI